MAADVEVVCPTEETLKTLDCAVPCSQQGCDRIFPNKPSLRMHLIKTHSVVTCSKEREMFAKGKSKSKVEKHFYCPAKYCTRGIENKRPFPRLGQLKQHYMTVHAEKKHKCSKCDRGFGMPDACRRHEEKCGELFPCSCGCPFTTREAMLTHARRKNHAVPPKDRIFVNQNSLSSQVNLNTTMMSTGCFPLVMSVSDMLGLPQLRQAEQLKNGFQQQGHQHQKPPTQEQRRCVTPKQCKRAKQQLKYRNILPKPLLHSVILNNPQAIPTGNVVHVLCQAPNGQRTLVKVDPISAQPPVPVLVKQNECESTQTITDVNTQDVHTQTHLNKQVQFQNHAETQTLAGSVQIHNPKQCQSVTGTQTYTQVQCLPFQRQTHTQTQLPVPISMHTQTSQLLTSAQTQTHAASVQLSSQGPTQEADMCEIETQTPDLMVDSSQTLNRDIDQPYSTESGKTEQSLHQTAVDSAAESGLLSLENSIQNLANSNSQGGCLVKSIHTGTDVTDCSEDFSTFDTIPLDIHTQTPVSSLDFDFSDMRFSSSVQTLSSAFTSVEDNETQTLISSLDLDLADSGTQTQSFLDEMLCSASFSDTETQTWLSNWPITDSGTENQILEELVHMETQTIPLLPELEDITLTDTHTQTFQDDFVGSMLLSTNVQTQTCVARQDLDVINNMSLNSTCSTQTLQRGIDESYFESTDVQTQTLTFPSGTESSIFGRCGSATLTNTETQTHIGALT